MGSTPGAKIAESVLAGGLLLGVLLALADTPFYPFAFGAVGIAALYMLMEHPTAIPGWVTWAGKTLHGS